MATKRAPNFTEMEKELLVSLVAERRHVLENKKTDAVTLKVFYEFHMCTYIYLSIRITAHRKFPSRLLFRNTFVNVNIGLYTII